MWEAAQLLDRCCLQGPTRRWPHRPAVPSAPLRLRVPRVAFKGTRLLGISSARLLQAC